MIQDSEWKYCYWCEAPFIKCPDCEHSSCSGMGCEKCSDRFKEAIKCVNEERHPPLETIPGYVTPEQAKLMRDMEFQKLEGNSTLIQSASNEELWNRIIKELTNENSS